MNSNAKAADQKKSVKDRKRGQAAVPLEMINADNAGALRILHTFLWLTA
ncbi:hypothetical protein [Tengunoibacter tsumagoiensis]|nr:hypothetical protein [Tengunoibacter tsumagoiensis]